MKDEVFAYLTTTGRVTGQPHTIEIWFAANHDAVYLLSGGGDRADWVRNIMANGEATIRIGSDELGGRGRVIASVDEQAIARRLVFEKYQPRKDNDLTNWRDTALPLAIDLA
jgi:deazaflavin-dependent oxidoreductase (nitroreductase family)